MYSVTCRSYDYNITIHLKIVIKEFLDLINLTKAQSLYVHQLTKVVIVCKNINFVFIFFK